MPLCTVCTHPQRETIDAALLAHRVGYRVVAGRFGLEKSSVHRHLTEHLAEQMRAAEEARRLASTESLIAEMNWLSSHVRDVLDSAEAAEDARLRLLGVAEGRRNVETLAKLGPLGEIESRIAALEAANPRPPSPRVSWRPDREREERDDDETE